MNGQHISGTPIVVDYWRLNNVPPRSLFFLTHMHADHTSGLSHRWPHNIHCTPVTAKLLIRKFKIQPRLVVELEVGESKILRVNTPDDAAPVNITVTTLDANHCPGSAMFLFEGYFGRILYTGDFRFCPSMLENQLLNGSRSIDVLYLDNTYCDPQCNFPTRAEAAEEVISLIKAHCDKLIIIGFHTLGKEDLLVNIANTLKTPIGVSEEQYKTLEILEMPNVFTRHMEDTHIQVFPFHMVSKHLLAEMKSDALAILPTCLYTGQSALEPPCQEYIKVVPYSDHSSFPELRQFVKSVRPRCVRPIVRSFSGDRSSMGLLRGNMSIFYDLLDPTPTPEIPVPSGILKLLSTKSSGSSMDSSPQTPLSHSRLNSIPNLKRSGTSGSSNMSHRNRPKGVQYISPMKLNYHPVTNTDSESTDVKATDENPVGLSDSPSAIRNLNHNDIPFNRDSNLTDIPHIEEAKQNITLPQVQQHVEVLPLPPSADTGSSANPRVSRVRKTISISLETDSTCQRTSGFSLPTERVIHSKDKDKNNTTSFSCARVRPIERLQLRRYRESDDVDISFLSPKTHKESSREPIEDSFHTLPQGQPSHSKQQSSSNSPASCQSEEEVTNSQSSLSKTSQTLCDEPIELVHVTPLPKLASPNALEHLYGIEPSRREMVTKNGGRSNKKRLNYSSPSEQPREVKKKRNLQESLDISTQSTKRPRILPPDIFSDQTNNVSENSSTVQGTNVELERMNGCLLAKLEETGLLRKLKKVDLSSPAVVKIMHSALNAAQTIHSSNFDDPSRKLPSALPPLDCDPCDESRLQGFTHRDYSSHPPLGCDRCGCDSEEICRSRLESFTHQDNRCNGFLEWIVTYDPF